MVRGILCVALWLGSTGLVWADFAKVETREAFMGLVSGKTLMRPLVRMTVSGNGTIEGMGARWEITGNWSWKDGFFCRDLNWGGDDIGYNCQEVRSKGNRIRFTSDKGSGDYADFRLK